MDATLKTIPKTTSSLISWILVSTSALTGHQCAQQEEIVQDIVEDIKSYQDEQGPQYETHTEHKTAD